MVRAPFGPPHQLEVRRESARSRSTARADDKQARLVSSGKMWSAIPLRWPAILCGHWRNEEHGCPTVRCQRQCHRMAPRTVEDRQKLDASKEFLGGGEESEARYCISTMSALEQ